MDIYTTYQALRVLEACCTVYSDSAAAISRAQTDRAGPEQAFVRAIIEITEKLGACGGTFALRWTPAHKGVEGNEVADDFAKGSGGKHMGCGGLTVSAGGACLAHLARETAEVRTQSWIVSHVQKQPVLPATEGKQPPPQSSEGEGADITGSGACLAEKIHKILSGECWWCGSGERQSRHHLFFRCRAGRGCERTSRRHAGPLRQTTLPGRGWGLGKTR